MSDLKPGTRCVIIAGCPENIGVIVEVIEHLGHYDDREDAYYVRTASGRPFKQLWAGNDLVRGHTDKCVTDRHKLRPLVDPDGDEITEDGHELPSPRELAGHK